MSAEAHPGIGDRETGPVHTPDGAYPPFDAPSAGPNGCLGVPRGGTIATAPYPLGRSSTVATRGPVIQALVMPSPTYIH